MSRPPIIAPSILAGDHARLADSASLVARLGLAWIHLDIMDGHFVPNLSFGPETLAALRRSSQWRKRAWLITTEVPVDMWRELCWRYVVFPARVGDRATEIIFAVYLRPHRPVIHSALVDSASGEVLPWPVAPAKRRRVFAQLPWAGPEPAGARGLGADAGSGSVSPFASPSVSGAAHRPDRRPGAGGGLIPAGMLSAPSGDYRIPKVKAEPSAPSPLDDLPFSSDL